MGDISLLSIEILTAILALGILVIGLIVPREQRKGMAYLTAIGLTGVLGVAIYFVSKNVSGTLFDGMYTIDGFSTFFKILTLTAAILVTLAANTYIEKLNDHRGEFFVLIISAALGMMVMASSTDLIGLYIALELMTISFYVLTGYRKGDSLSAEAGLKYIILGAMSSAILLYGMSLVYGMTGTTLISDIASYVAKGDIQPALILGLVMLIGGFGFKISAVPFHMWSPDIYHGAPTPVTAFLGVGSKAAAFAVFVRVFVNGFGSISDRWTFVLAVVAALTIIIGNLVAIPQTNIKRMLAYSSVAQAGYILTGLVAANELGVKGIMFYLMLYVFATIGAFAVAIAFYRATGSDEIKDYAGLAQRSPMLAAVLTVCMLSMAGIPPLAGFVGKFYLFQTIIENYMWLAFIGLIMSMASVYYYLSVARVMYGEDPVDNTPITTTASMKFVLLVSLIATILIGVYPRFLSELSNWAAGSLF